MLKYKLFDRISGEYIVSLNSKIPNVGAKIEITTSTGGDDRFIPIIRNWLQHECGAFGHIIGEATTPIDLDAAMHSKDALEFRPEIMAGAELVKSYNPGIPEGAVT